MYVCDHWLYSVVLKNQRYGAVGRLVVQRYLVLPPATGVVLVSRPFETVLNVLGAVIAIDPIDLSPLSPG